MAKEFVYTKVVIENVVHDCPYDCYRVKELERKFRWKFGESSTIKYIDDISEEELSEYRDKFWRLNSELEIVD